MLRKQVDYDSFGQIRYEEYYDGAGLVIEGTEPSANPAAIEQFFCFQGRPWDAVA